MPPSLGRAYKWFSLAAAADWPFTKPLYEALKVGVAVPYTFETLAMVLNVSSIWLAGWSENK